MIKTISVSAAATVGETSQMDVVRFGTLGNLGHSLAILPWFVSRFTHGRSIPHSQGRCESPSSPVASRQSLGDRSGRAYREVLILGELNLVGKAGYCFVSKTELAIVTWEE